MKIKEELISDQELLDVIKKHEGENMTVRRLAQLLGYSSPSSVHNRLEKLEAKGLIKRERLSLIKVKEV
ncbi:MarR family transcriptional regulator [Tissierella carlieri]|uniref:MarR family transcriptional regulator n=1 Tax=Tissierella carlieri TaxID=689904 RepID=UPI001C1090C5|nr:MarR family transcriptional regulator [Tissierella carlieri]MBU5311886.1 MarR family transcriptional regulator [Tissierella carlieri]